MYEVYAIKDAETGMLLYVGMTSIGIEKRFAQHVEAAMRREHCNKLLGKAIRERDAEVACLGKKETVEQTQQLEKELIAQHTEEENFCNLRAGGTGWQLTPKGRENASESSQKRWTDPVYRNAVTAAITKRMRNPERRKQSSEVMSQTLKKKWEEPQYRAKRTQAIAKMWEDKAFREKTIRATHTGEAEEKRKKTMAQARPCRFGCGFVGNGYQMGPHVTWHCPNAPKKKGEKSNGCNFARSTRPLHAEGSTGHNV